MALDYENSERFRIVKKTDDIIANLPDYCKRFIYSKRGNENYRVKTVYAYAVDLQTFFFYLTQCNPLCKGKNPVNIDIDILKQIDVEDIEEYLSYLSSYSKPGPNGTIHTYSNSKTGKARKLSALKSLYRYLVAHHYLSENPLDKIEPSRKPGHDVIAMDASEQTRFVLTADSDTEMKSARSLKLHEKTKLRDLAIIYVFLGTGIRVSELVGLDTSDIDLEEKYMIVYRKGGKHQFVHFSEEVRTALSDYLLYCRDSLKPDGDNENALFISLHHKRMSVRMIEILIKQYAIDAKILGADKITPHKLRSTYATQLLEKTGNIKLVADALGHSDLSTVSRYAKVIDKKAAADVDIIRTE